MSDNYYICIHLYTPLCLLEWSGAPPLCCWWWSHWGNESSSDRVPVSAWLQGQCKWCSLTKWRSCLAVHHSVHCQLSASTIMDQFYWIHIQGASQINGDIVQHLQKLSHFSEKEGTCLLVYKAVQTGTRVIIFMSHSYTLLCYSTRTVLFVCLGLCICMSYIT